MDEEFCALWMMFHLNRQYTKRWKWKEDGGSVKEIESNLYYYNRKVKVNAFVDEDEKPAFMDDVSPQQKWKKRPGKTRGRMRRQWMRSRNNYIVINNSLGG